MNRRLDLEAVAAERHEHAAGGHLAGLRAAKLGVVHAPVDAIDHHPGPIGDLVDHANADDLADQRCLARAALEQRHAGGSTLDADFLERALHHLELVGPQAEEAKRAQVFEQMDVALVLIGILAGTIKTMRDTGATPRQVASVLRYAASELEDTGEWVD